TAFANQQGTQGAEAANGEHADDDLRVLNKGVGIPGVVTDAVLATDDLASQKREPGHTHADRQSGDNRRHGAGQYHMPENGGAACAKASCGSNQHAVGLFHTVDGVKDYREERAQKSNEYDAGLLGWQHQNGQRNPGHRGDGPQQLDVRQDNVFRPARAPHRDAQKHSENYRQDVSDGNSFQAVQYVQVEFLSRQLCHKCRADDGGRGNVVEIDVEVETVIRSELPEH